MEPSKRVPGRPKGSRDKKPRECPPRPAKWCFTVFGKYYRFQTDVPLYRRIILCIVFGGSWRKT